jgi:hypothetical protein
VILPCISKKWFLAPGASHLLIGGRPDPQAYPLRKVIESLQWARVLRGVGDPAATDHLAAAYAVLAIIDYPRCRAEADALARGF